MLKDILKKDKKTILNELEDIHGYDLAKSFLELSNEEKEKLYKVISNDVLAEIVSYLEPDLGASLLQEFDLVKQKSLIENMEPDDAVDIIQEMDKEEQQALISVLDNQEEVLSLINYDEDETGSAMTTLVIKLNLDLDVKQATKMVIKQAPDVETISTLFVVNDQDQYVGVVPLKTLLKAKPPLKVEDLFVEHPYVNHKDEINETVSKIRNYAIYEMPVVDDENHLLGMITLDDALDIYQEEAQEDFEKFAGLPETIDRNVVKTAIYRAPWLLLLLIIAIPIAYVTSLFEETLAMVAILIVFQPLILDSAGNVATQTLAVTLKMYATNEKGLIKNSVREFFAGFMNGFIIGVIAFLMTYLFANINVSLTTNPLKISFVIGLSLWLTVAISPIIAIIVPSVLKAIKIDPATASGPFITTLIDVGALLIYFGMATLMLF